MKILKLCIVGLLSLLPQLAFSGPIHSHCDIKTWALTTPSPTNPPSTIFPVDYRPGGTDQFLSLFTFNPVLNIVPPPSSIPDCFYEISDITRISITFTFEGTMTWQRLCIGGIVCLRPGDPAFDPRLPIDDILIVTPLTFTSGVTRNFRFEPHLGIDPIELRLPRSGGSPAGTFPISFGIDNNAFSITSATISLSGSHYYIPEPGTLLLVLAAVTGLLHAKARRGKKSVSSSSATAATAI